MKKLPTFLEFLKEEGEGIPANNIGSGHIAGYTDPGVPPSRSSKKKKPSLLRRKK